MLTLANLLAGCAAIVFALQYHAYETAFWLIIAAAVFDFLDGFAARLLKQTSPLGVQLDSLADDVTFGLAPAIVMYDLYIHSTSYYGLSPEVMGWLKWGVLIIAAFSALRLGKFNIDPRQSSSFIGLPTPANALFWGSLVVGAHSFLVSDSFNAIYLFILVILMSYLLVAELPMFSLKFKNLSWKDNKVSYIFLLICIPLLAVFRISGFAAIILWYILWSLLTRKKA